MGATVAGYDFQAFFSYKRNPLTDYWHERVFERLQYWIGQELGIDKPPMFFDRRSIENGQEFDAYIRDALLSSAVIVSIFSPLYFTSKWCVSEFESFLAREEKLKFKKGSLVACARFHDGENYPIEAQKMQAEDFRDFAILAPKFWDSDKAVTFEQLIMEFAKKIAKKIKLAPPFETSFPIQVMDDKDVPEQKMVIRPSDYAAGRNGSSQEAPKGP
jgi:hypothetical protein